MIGYVQCDMVALSKNTGLPHKLLTKIQQCLLLEFASHSTTAASIWHKLRDDTVTLLSTGTHSHTHTHTHTHTNFFSASADDMTGANKAAQSMLDRPFIQLLYSVLCIIVLITYWVVG